MSDSNPEVRRLGSISFRYVEAEDRICCIGIPAGVATGHFVMWLTNRLGYKFLESVHEKRPDRVGRSAAEVDGSELRSMVDYGFSVQRARSQTQNHVQRGDALAKAPVQQANWLVRKLQVRKKDEMINLILVGDKEAAGCALSASQFLRIVDMLEDAFKSANWDLPERSYSNLGSKLAETSGQSLN